VCVPDYIGVPENSIFALNYIREAPVRPTGAELKHKIRGFFYHSYGIQSYRIAQVALRMVDDLDPVGEEYRPPG
jgi:hypothetical protein